MVRNANLPANLIFECRNPRCTTPLTLEIDGERLMQQRSQPHWFAVNCNAKILTRDEQGNVVSEIYCDTTNMLPAWAISAQRHTHGDSIDVTNHSDGFSISGRVISWEPLEIEAVAADYAQEEA